MVSRERAQPLGRGVRRQVLKGESLLALLLEELALRGRVLAARLQGAYLVLQPIRSLEGVRAQPSPARAVFPLSRQLVHPAQLLLDVFHFLAYSVVYPAELNLILRMYVVEADGILGAFVALLRAESTNTASSLDRFGDLLLVSEVVEVGELAVVRQVAAALPSRRDGHVSMAQRSVSLQVFEALLEAHPIRIPA